MTCYHPCKAIAVMGFVCLLLLNGSHQRGEPPVAGTTTTANVETKSGGIFDSGDAGGGRGKVVHPEWHLNYMSKRRVPNGPDPIHNRYCLLSSLVEIITS